MKILIVQPMGSGSPPLGLCLISAVLKRAGYTDIALVDLMVDNVADQVVSSLRTEKYLQKKLEENPDIILLTAALPTFHFAMEMSQKLRKYCKVLMFGGPHATMFKDVIIKNCPQIDLLVVGEADLTIVPIMKQIEENISTGKYNFTGIPNVVWRKGSEIIINKLASPIMDLDQFPAPDRDIIDLGSYHAAFSILTSRGCPMQCTFCSRPVTGSTFRGRSAENVVDEMEMMLNKYPEIAERCNKTFAIVDENFGVNKQRVIAICDEILKRELKLRIILPNGLHVTGAQDMEVLKKLKAVNCDLIFFGVESGNDQVLRNIKKGANRNIIIKAVKNCHDAGIQMVGGHFIIGLPGDTPETVRETIKFFEEESGLDTANFNHAIPHPGTPFWDYVIEHGKFYCEYTPVMDYSNFYFENNKSKLFYEKIVFDTPEFTKEQRIIAYNEAVTALDRKMRNRILSFKNIKRFTFSIQSFADIIWALKRFYSVTTKHDLRRVYEPRPQRIKSTINASSTSVI